VAFCNGRPSALHSIHAIGAPAGTGSDRATASVVETEHALRTISSRSVLRSVDPREVVATLQRVASPPTAPYHEWRALDAIAVELKRLGLVPARDAYGQLSVQLTHGIAERTLVLVAHTDHPGFEVTEVAGARGLARFRGGIEPKYFSGRLFPLIAHRDGVTDGARATGSGYVHDPVLPDWSAGYCEIASERPLAVGDWAVLDVPAFERRGNELHLRSADDLAGCAAILSTLQALRDETRPFSVHAVFTRAEEPGLFGARLIAEDASIPKDAYVVSVEASRALSCGTRTP